MSNNNVMPKVEFGSDKLKTAEAYTKYIEAKNLERAIVAKKVLTKKRLLFTGSLGLAIGIYAYTILKIKQETFLDDFEEPPRIIKS